MRVFKATGLRYPINIVSGGEGVYILSGVKEKRQESEIDTIVWVFQLLLAGIVHEPETTMKNGVSKILCDFNGSCHTSKAPLLSHQG